MLTIAREFFGPVKNSVKGEVVKEEVTRSSFLSFISGSGVLAVMSLVWAFIQAVLSDPNLSTNFQTLYDFFKEKNYIALGVSIATFILDYLRRKYLHGV